MKNGPQNCEMVSRKSRLLGAAAAKKEEGKFIFLINTSLYLSTLFTISPKLPTLKIPRISQKILVSGFSWKKVISPHDSSPHLG